MLNFYNDSLEMKSVIRRKRGKNFVINWFEIFNASTGIREDTYDFAAGEISSKEWVKLLSYHKPAKEAAQMLIKHRGVKGAKRAARMYMNRCYD